MAENTKIEWADHSASPWHGCSNATYLDKDGNETSHEGCRRCYAETMARRNPGTLGVWGKDGTRVMSASFAKNCRRWNKEIQAGRVAWELHVELCKQFGIADPAKEWAVRSGGEPIPPSFATVFPSICDPFEDWQGPIVASGKEPVYLGRDGRASHSKNPRMTIDDLRRDLFALIDECQSLRFLLLTKRPENVRRMWTWGWGTAETLDKRPDKSPSSFEKGVMLDKQPAFRPNVYLLTSVSDQATADAMIPELLKCRDLVPTLGVSLEPMLGPVDLQHIQLKERWPGKQEDSKLDCLRGFSSSRRNRFVLGGICEEKGITPFVDRENFGRIDWVIVGGESGHGARPCRLEWIRSIRDQCKEAGVACFVKQLGSRPECEIGWNQSKISCVCGSIRKR